MSKTLRWARFYGHVVNTDGNRVIIKPLNLLYNSISIKIEDVYVDNEGKVFVRESAMVRRLTNATTG